MATIDTSPAYQVIFKLNAGTTEQGALKITDWTLNLMHKSNPSYSTIQAFGAAFERLSKYKVITEAQAKQKNIGAYYVVNMQVYS